MSVRGTSTRKWNRWLPTSKMTAVGISGAMVVYGSWGLWYYYGISLEPWVASGWTVLISWTIGYVVTEHRGANKWMG